MYSPWDRSQHSVQLQLSLEHWTTVVLDKCMRVRILVRRSRLCRHRAAYGLPCLLSGRVNSSWTSQYAFTWAGKKIELPFTAESVVDFVGSVAVISCLRSCHRHLERVCLQRLIALFAALTDTQ